MASKIIHIHGGAPAKPPSGQPCNGCGICCLYEPCPLGRLLSRRRDGACVAVYWDAVLTRYRCGALVMPERVLRQTLPQRLTWLSPVVASTLGRVAGRWISAGSGCDCDLDVSPYPAQPQSGGQSTP